MKIALYAINLANFRWNALYEGPGKASFAVVPVPTVIITASTYSVHDIQLW